MNKIILPLLAFLFLSACATSNPKYCIMKYHEGKISSIFEYIEMLEKEQDHCFKKSYYEDQIRDLSMQNAALQSANKFLLKLIEVCKEDRAKNAPCVYGVKYEQTP